MAAPTVEVIPREQFRKVLAERSPEFRELCKKSFELYSNPRRIRGIAEEATHILRLAIPEGQTSKTVAFAYLDADPCVGDECVSYGELSLLCGSYTFQHGKTTWKGSEVLVDKAMQLAKEAGKSSLRLQALNEALYEKVYKPMGFVPVEKERLVYERPIPSGGRRASRLHKKTRRSKRHRGGRVHRKLRKLTTRRR